MLTPWEFVRGHQCDQGGHRGPGYLGLVWDSHLAYPAHIRLVFQVSKHIEFNMMEEKVVTLGFSRETLKLFLTSSIQ
jgi:hypothetical protein